MTFLRIRPRFEWVWSTYLVMFWNEYFKHLLYKHPFRCNETVLVLVCVFEGCFDGTRSCWYWYWYVYSKVVWYCLKPKKLFGFGSNNLVFSHIFYGWEGKAYDFLGPLNLICCLQLNNVDFELYFKWILYSFLLSHS